MLNISLPTDDRTILIIILATAGAFALFSLVTLISRLAVRAYIASKFSKADEYAAIIDNLGKYRHEPPDVQGAYVAKALAAVYGITKLPDAIAKGERRLGVLTGLNLLSTIATVLFVGAAIVSYFLGHTQTALQLDVVGIVLFAVKASVSGVLATMAGRWYTRVMDARQKAEQKPQK